MGAGKNTLPVSLLAISFCPELESYFKHFWPSVVRSVLVVNECLEWFRVLLVFDL